MQIGFRLPDMSVRSTLAYTLTSGFCLLLHNVVMVLADGAGCSVPVALMQSFGLTAVVGYLLHCRFTFLQPVSGVGFWHYVLAMSANIPLSLATTWFWRTVVDLPMAVAAPTASLCMVAANFLLSRWAIGHGIRAPARGAERCES